MTSTPVQNSVPRRTPPIDTVGFAGNSDIFFAAVALTRMPMLVTDPSQPDNPIAFANQAFCDLTGYPASDLVGRNCRFLQGADSDRATVDRIREAIRQQSDIAVEILNYRRNGESFWNALYISPVFAGDGRLLYHFASQLDVTRRREAERALEQAQRLEGLGSLAGGVAHEFNNLLTVIHGNLEPLIRTATDRRTTVRLGRVRHAAERAATLTRSMIAFARRQRLEDQPLDVGAFLRSILPDLGRLVQPEASITLELPVEPCFVRADPQQLRTALINIVLNAWEAHPRSHTVRVRVESRRMIEGPPGEVAITVIDDGIGMSAEIAAQAVDPFFTTKEPGAGVGLGLSTAYGFAQQTGGRLDIASRPGEGTSVSMSLPAHSPLQDFVGHAQHGEVVLIVDDDAATLQRVTTMLEQLGFGVVTAASAEEALALLGQSLRIDLMITESVLPGLSGQTFAERARALRPKLPVIFASNLAGNDIPDSISKPVNLPELNRRLREALDSAGYVATG